MPVPLSIVASGTRTPLGLRSAAAAAALRAGINRLGEHPEMVDRLGNPMVAAMDARLDPCMPYLERLTALVAAALPEACAPLQLTSAGPLTVAMHLALPEVRPGFSEQDAAIVKRGVQRLVEGTVAATDVSIYPAGHAAGVVALEAVQATLAAGTHDACLLGGVESYFQLETMRWLDSHRQLAGEDGRSSFVPGEGAGFLLLMTERMRTRLSLSAQGRVVAHAVAHEAKMIKTPEVCLGEGLIKAVQAALSAATPPGPVNQVICDINGERYRSQEWGFVCLNAASYFDDPTDYWSPAGSWGDMGAASIPLFGMLACQSAIRGYASGPRTMLWASSEGGLRGAAIVDA